ncbi:MAG: hypothetical protein V1743_02220 [Nanoarchaeota archaeon]
MKNIVKAAVLVAGVASFVMATNMLGSYIENRELREHQQEQRRAFIPQPLENQQLILHPEYLQGYISKGYTLLTDIDYDGSWDCAEEYHAGFTTGDGYHRLFFKKGFGPARSLSEEVEMMFVDEDFFKPYQ